LFTSICISIEPFSSGDYYIFLTSDPDPMETLLLLKDGDSTANDESSRITDLSSNTAATEVIVTDGSNTITLNTIVD